MNVEIVVSHTKKTYHPALTQSPVRSTFLAEGDVTASFVIDDLQQEEIQLVTADIATFSKTISFAGSNELAFLSAFYIERPLVDSYEKMIPLTFQVSVGGNTIGIMSQLCLHNCDSFTDDIVFSNFQDPGSEKTGLFVLLLANK